MAAASGYYGNHELCRRKKFQIATVPVTPQATIVLYVWIFAFPKTFNYSRSFRFHLCFICFSLFCFLLAYSAILNFQNLTSIVSAAQILSTSLTFLKPKSTMISLFTHNCRSRNDRFLNS